MTTARRIHTDPATGIRTRSEHGPTWAERELRKSPERPEFPMPDERLYITGQNSGRNGTTLYEANLVRACNPEPMRVVVTDSAYWADGRNCYQVNAWGTSRTLEILLSIGHALGYSHAEIQQNRRVEL
jgi:hypothetical protein